MYVHGVTELEIKSPEEALEAFQRGQKQRSVSATLLNTQSSRSHSIFNIRVVACPLDPMGEEIISDPSLVTVSQLALVDLAGSERTNRTGNTGQRLAEASKINQSLMTLRTCLEILRDNQATGSAKPVPYRDSRVTHLFRNYFEGEGKVKMVVCVNPRPADYEENVNVMQFSEMTQEVLIERAIAMKPDLGLTPGRKRANQVYKEAVRRLEEQGEDVRDLVMDLSPVYSLGPEWPPLEVDQFDNEDIIEKLRKYLEKRIKTRRTLLADLGARQDKFRKGLVKMEEENVLMKNELRQLKAQLEVEKKKNSGLEQRLVRAEDANKDLNQQLGAYHDLRQVLEFELDEKELALNELQKERLRNKLKYKAKINNEREKLNTELEMRMMAKEREFRQKHSKERAQINAMKNILYRDETTEAEEDEENQENRLRAISSPNLPSAGPSTRTRARRERSSSPRRSVAVANPKTKRRSKSTDVERWLDHQPKVGGPVPSNTVFQPKLRSRRSLSKLERSDLETPSKYMLTTASAGEGGEVETRLFKGNVIPTIGGGRQVVFDDVEVLTQQSPGESNTDRKRSYENYVGIGDRIAALNKGGLTGGQTPGKSKRSRH